MAKDVLNKHTLGDEYEETFNHVLTGKSSENKIIASICKYVDFEVTWVSLLMWIIGMLYCLAFSGLGNGTWLGILGSIIVSYIYWWCVKKYMNTCWNYMMRYIHKF